MIKIDTTPTFQHPRKFAAIKNYVSYAMRITPYFDTVEEVAKYEKENNIETSGSYTHPATNWKQVIANRTDINTASHVPQGQ